MKHGSKLKLAVSVLLVSALSTGCVGGQETQSSVNGESVSEDSSREKRQDDDASRQEIGVDESIFDDIELEFSPDEKSAVIWWSRLTKGEKNQLVSGLDHETVMGLEKINLGPAGFEGTQDRLKAAVTRRLADAGKVEPKRRASETEGYAGVDYGHWREKEAERQTYRNAMKTEGGNPEDTFNDSELDY